MKTPNLLMIAASMLIFGQSHAGTSYSNLINFKEKAPLKECGGTIEMTRTPVGGDFSNGSHVTVTLNGVTNCTSFVVLQNAIRWRYRQKLTALI